MMDLEIIDKVKEYAKDMSILYVEDEKDTRVEVVKVLEKIFKSVSVAKDGQEGLELYIEAEFDIVISDIEMPNLDGVDMVDRIKKINKNQVIAIFSGHSRHDYIIKLINLGVDVFVLKPFDLETFFQAIYKIVKEQKHNNKEMSLVLQ